MELEAMAVRLDSYLHQKKITESRQYAQRIIRDNRVIVNGRVCTKVAQLIYEDDEVQVLESTNRQYVSRGGYKLEAAIKSFSLDFSNKVVMDIGASTGGFTDCALHHGAANVVSIDVGSNQIHPSLRNRNEIQIIENTNFRTFTNKEYYHKFDIVVIDVSFISLSHIFENLSNYLSTNSLIVALIKPQFEAGPEMIGKNGVIKGKNKHVKIIEKVIMQAKVRGYELMRLHYSPIQGERNGNIEFLGLFSSKAEVPKNYSVRSTVEQAYSFFKESE
jgi:23S rRNA (cytidine1920-2'-O)/16S rRNA (cytidine1409-2'-O)-methyltransferase